MATSDAAQAKRFRAKWRAIAHSAQTAPPPTLLSMPYEILANICEMAPQGTIFNIALVCRGLRCVATNSLFVAPCLKGWAAGSSFRDAFYQDPLRLVLVRELFCEAWSKWLPWFEKHVRSLRNLVKVHLANGKPFEEGGCFCDKGFCCVDDHDCAECDPCCSLCDYECDCDFSNCQCLDPYGEMERPAIDLAPTMTFLGKASAKVISASLVCPNLWSSSDLPACKSLRSLTLTAVELANQADYFTALGDSLPRLERLTIRLASYEDVLERFRSDWFPDEDPRPFDEAHFKAIEGAFPDLSSLKLDGFCEDLSGDALKATLRRCARVDIALKELVPTHDPCLGHFSAVPVLQAMPILRSLRLRLDKNFEGASALCDHITAGQMPLLHFVKLCSSFAQSKQEVEKVVIRDGVVGKRQACGFKVKYYDALTKVSGSRKV